MHNRQANKRVRAARGIVTLALATAALISAAAAGDAPQMSTPSGFDVSAAGAATYSVPMRVPPGTAGMVPQVSLNYSSQSGDGIVGYGFTLGIGIAPPDPARAKGQKFNEAPTGSVGVDSNGVEALTPPAAGSISGKGQTTGGLPAITRCAKTIAQDGVHGGVHHDAGSGGDATNDRFCLNGERLIVISGGYGASSSEYRTEIDNFTKVVAHGSAGHGPAWFEVHQRNGIVLEFGNTADSQILALSSTTARAWTLNKATDSKGNYFTITYTDDSTNGQFYPTRIDYTGNGTTLSPYNSVRFTYSTTRVDGVPMYQAGSLQKTTVLLTDIKTYQGSSVVLDYKLAYRAGTSTLHSRLTSITECDTTGTSCLAPTSFTWQGGTGMGTLSSFAVPDTSGLYATLSAVSDFNADGLADYLQLGIAKFGTQTSGTFTTPSLTITQSGSTRSANFFNVLEPATGVDFDGDGFSDVLWQKSLTGLGDIFLYDRAGNFNEVPAPTLGTTQTLAGDFDGDGRPDLVTWVKTSSTPLFYYLSGAVPGFYPGYFEYDSGNGDGTFTAVTSTDYNNVSQIAPTIWRQYDTMGFAADFSGSGCTDLVFSYGNYDSTYGGPIFPTPITGTTGFVIHYSCGGGYSPEMDGIQASVYGDFNGDGKTDFINWDASPANRFVYLSTGTSFVEYTTAIPSDCGLTIAAEDFNGDGRDDLACENATTGVWTVHLSTGTGFLSTGPTVGPFANYGAPGPDLDNDGAPDFFQYGAVYPTATDTQVYSFAYTPEMITDISNGIGSTTHIDYDRLNKNATANNDAPFYTKGTSAAYPQQDYDGAMYVVSKVTTSTGTGHTYENDYTYTGLKRDLHGRGMLGFTQIRVYDPQADIATVTNYKTDFPYIGLVASRTRVYKPDTAPVTISSTVNTWDSVVLTGTGTTFVFLKIDVASGADLNAAALPTVTTTYHYDCQDTPSSCYGQLLTDSASVSDGSSRLATYSSFVNDTTDWCFDEPQTTTEQRIVGSSNLTRTTSHTYGSCLVSQEVLEPSDASHRLQTDYVREITPGVPDPFGNVSDVIQSGGSGISAIGSRTTHYDYDALGEFVIDSVVQPSSTAATQTTTYTHDVRFGGVTQVKDPNNLATNTTYDTFGRLASVRPPDTTKVTTVYDYCSGVNGGTYSGCPTNGAVVVTATPLGTDAATQVSAIAKTYYDALYRVIATDVQGFGGNWIRAETQYDADLCVGQTSRPYFLSGGTAKWTVNTNDALCRPTTITRPDGGTTTTTFSGLTVISVVQQTSTISETTTTLKNAQGLVQTVTDTNSKHVNYTYDAFNNLTTIVDHSSNTTTNVYDIRGNRTDSTDPDMGHWVYAYDVLGELVQQTDPVEAAASQTTTLSYDLLGRLTQRVEPDQTSNWVYDTATTNGIGKLAYTCTGVGCTSTSYSFLRKQSYDSKGRPSTATLSINSSSGTTYHVTYDSLSGKVATIKYPSTFTIANHYQSLYGYLSSISDNATSATLWTITGRNAELQATGQTLGTGDTETQVFDANTGLVQQIRAGPSDSLANFSYGFDLIGNLTDRSDTLNTLSEHFCYDTLNRLTSYGVNLGTSCPQTGGKTITYNLLGNIKSKSDIATNYTYPSSGSSSVLPHAVSSITGTVGGLVNPHYCYDPNGNLTKVYTGGGGCTSTASKSVSWTNANMILQMVQGSTTVSLSYDEAHQRITQTEPSGTTAYFADPMTGAFAEQAGTTWNDYIAVDGKLVAEHIQPASPATPYMHYFINDHLGSVSVVVDAPNHALERDSYDAWGMRRNADGSDAPACNLVSSTKRGFTNQEMIDALCLVNLNARVYDPVIGRFLSADDVVDDPYDLQHLNRYSYVNNGPLSFTDPTGHDGFSMFNEMGMVSLASGGRDSGGGGCEAEGNCGGKTKSGGVTVHFLEVIASTIPTDKDAAAEWAAKLLGVPVSRIADVQQLGSSASPNAASQAGAHGVPLGHVVQGHSGRFWWAYQPYTNGVGGYGVNMRIEYHGDTAGVEYIQNYTWTGNGITYDEDNNATRPGYIGHDSEPRSTFPFYDSANFLGKPPGVFVDSPQRSEFNWTWRSTIQGVRINESGRYNILGTFKWSFDVQDHHVTQLSFGPVQ